MHDTQEVFYLLSIAKLASEWPDLRPIHNRPLEKLKAIAQEPAHKEPEKPARLSPVPLRKSDA